MGANLAERLWDCLSRLRGAHPPADEKEHPKELGFAPVLERELAQIDDRRRRLGLGEPRPDHPDAPRGELDRAEQRAADRRLVGLALSGGGIRSATFNLGLLQALARRGLLRYVDYLSTVSGGGYVGGWLAAWVRRDGFRGVEERLGPSQPSPAGTGPASDKGWGEPEPIRHLRRYSNYLAPRQGFLSADRWVLWAAYLRNFLLCQCVLLPAVVAVLLVARLVMLLYFPLPNWDNPPPWAYVLVTGLMAGFCLGALVLLFRGAALVRKAQDARDDGPSAEPMPETALVRRGPDSRDAVGPPSGLIPRAAAPRRMRPRGMLLSALLLTVAAVLFCWHVPYCLPFSERHQPGLAFSHAHLGQELAVFAASGLALVALALLLTRVALPRDCRDKFGRPVFLFGGVLAAGLVGGAILYGAYLLLHGLYDWDGGLARDYLQARATARLTTFGPPAVLLALVLAFSVAVGILNGRLREELREWWASLCGRLLVAAALWLAVTLVALYGTAMVIWAGPWARAVLSSGWLLTVAGGLFVGGGPDSGPAQPRRHPLEWLARLAPHVFVIGLLVGVSLLVHVGIDNPPRAEHALDAVWYRDVEPERPPIRVTESTTRASGKAEATREHRDTIERAEVIDPGEVREQMYWLGILNIQPGFIPKETYRLSAWDLESLRERGVPDALLQQLCALVRDRAYALDRKDFFAAMNQILPVETPYTYRRWVIQFAKDVKSMEFDRSQLAVKLVLFRLAPCLALLALAAWCVDVNLFSLHAVYGNRLTRAYLGASRPRAPAATYSHVPKPGERSPDPVTLLDPADDLRLADLRPRGDGTGYDGPYLIVNTALNLVRGRRLDWQERKAESFVLTPRYCGSVSTGFRPTAAGYAGHLTLGAAITISGAAASPNMGYHSSPSVTALLTFFNARLGAWLGNPASPTRWRRAGPCFGFVHLFRELFGITRDDGGYVYLSDGGHFENLGAYELVRRRCHYVVVSDAGRDSGHAFEDLANLIRKCRVDFGVRIEIDLTSVRLDQARRSRWHCAIGTIRYDDVDPRAVPGTLVYLKPSLTGDEPGDVQHYAAAHRDFPHETTSDQFFNESQFESYRALGEHVADAVFAASLADLRDAERGVGGAAGRGHRGRCRELFASVVRRWFAIPPEYEAAFLRTTEAYAALHEALREEPLLARLSADLYPELFPAPTASTRARKESAADHEARRRLEVHVVAQMFQVMQNAWLSLNLDAHYAHPLNRGWMDVFHRWTSARAVREYWPFLRAEFGRGFVSFCEKQMRMGAVTGRAVPLEQGAAIPELLLREFAEQWPRQRPLEERVGGAEHVWLVYPEGPYAAATADTNGKPPTPAAAPCGVIAVERTVEDGRPATAANGDPVHELHVWVRGAYRNTGLGRPAVGQVLRELVDRLRPPFRLRVRLPLIGLTGPGGELQQNMWLTFFHHHEFERVQPVRCVTAPAPGRAEPEPAVLLERVFLARPPSAPATPPAASEVQ